MVKIQRRPGRQPQPTQEPKQEQADAAATQRAAWEEKQAARVLISKQMGEKIYLANMGHYRIEVIAADLKGARAKALAVVRKLMRSGPRGYYLARPDDEKVICHWLEFSEEDFNTLQVRERQSLKNETVTDTRAPGRSLGRVNRSAGGTGQTAIGRRSR